MAIPTSPDRRARGAVAFLARWVLPVALIVPTAVLFAQARQTTGDDAAFAGAERHGIAFLRTLVPLEIELVHAQATAVAGATVQREPLIAAVGTATRLDGEYGAELLTHDRWTDVRNKIEAVPLTGAPADVFAGYGEAIDLLLDLIDRVRVASGLARDPHAETFDLADGGAQELPEAIAAAGRYTGLVVRARGLAPAAQADALFAIADARSDLVGSAGDLADDVQLAAQGTASQSLDAALLTRIDRFSRATDALVPATATAAATLAADPAQLVKNRDELVLAGAELSGSLLNEIDRLLRERVSGLEARETTALAALLVAIVLGLAVPLTLLLSRLRRRPRTPRSAGLPPPAWARAEPLATRQWPDDLQSGARHDGGERVRAAR